MSVRTLVCYLLAPGEEYAQKAREFADSYRNHFAGRHHDFLLVIKEGANVVPLLRSDLIAEHHPNNDGWDIYSFQRVCQDHADYDYVMWFGSNSRILVGGWLIKMLNGMSHRDVGAVGPTGSFESGVSNEMPNPHLRTSTFMMSPKLFNSLDYPLVDTRRSAYELEHGCDSLTRRLRKIGLRCLVVGRDGITYGESAWPTSRTYRRNGQQNLLIADKHTDIYAAADADERLVLRKMTWQ